MSRTISYYFTLVSPWTYLGHAAFLEVVGRRGCAVSYRPVPLRSVFDETGGLPLPKRHPVRQRYRMLELQRWREHRNLPLVLQPKHFPYDPSLADRMVIAIAKAGGDPGRFAGEVLAGLWARDEDLSAQGRLGELADSVGLDSAALLAAADSDDVRAAYEATRGEAIAAGVFGAPSYVLDGEVFWGQDRIALLDAALASGRSAYRPDPAA